jgi:hypothetical protein
LNGAKDIVVKWVDSVREISPDLFDHCFRPPLEGRWWYETLEHSHLQDQFTFAYAVIYQSGRPVGIAPTFYMRVPMELVAPPEVVKLLNMVPVLGKIFPFLECQKTLFVGSPCADEGTVGLAPGVDLGEVASTLQIALYERAAKVKADMVAWKDFREQDAVELEPLIEHHGMFPSVSYPGTTVQLAPGGLSEYFKSLKSSRRHKLLKKLRRSKELIQLDVEVVQRPSPHVIDEIFALFNQTYAQAETKFEKLNRRFFEEIAQKDVSHFVMLRTKEERRLVAFMLCFQLGTRVINKFIGLNYAEARTNYLYFRLWEAALEWAISTGASEFQSGQTGYSAKIDIGNSLVPLTNYCRHRNPIIHWFYKEVAKTLSWSSIDNDLAVYLKAHPEDRHLSVVQRRSRSQRHQPKHVLATSNAAAAWESTRAVAANKI